MKKKRKKKSQLETVTYVSFYDGHGHTTTTTIVGAVLLKFSATPITLETVNMLLETGALRRMK